MDAHRQQQGALFEPITLLCGEVLKNRIAKSAPIKQHVVCADCFWLKPCIDLA